MAVPPYFRELFRREAGQWLGELRIAVGELAASPHEPACLGRVQRLVHTLACAAAMFGFEAASTLARLAERALDQVRPGQGGSDVVGRQAADLIFDAGELLAALLGAGGVSGETFEARVRWLTLALEALAAAREPEAERHPRPAAPEGAAIYVVRLRLPREAFRRGVDPLALLKELSTLGVCCTVALTEAVPRLEELAPDLCYLGWDVILTAACDVSAVREVFRLVEGEVEVQELEPPASGGGAAPPAGDEER